MLQTRIRKSSHGLILHYKAGSKKVGTKDIFAKRKRLQKLVPGPMKSNLSLNVLKMSREYNVQIILNASWEFSKEKKGQV